MIYILLDTLVRLLEADASTNIITMHLLCHYLHFQTGAKVIGIFHMVVSIILVVMSAIGSLILLSTMDDEGDLIQTVSIIITLNSTTLMQFILALTLLYSAYKGWDLKLCVWTVLVRVSCWVLPHVVLDVAMFLFVNFPVVFVFWFNQISWMVLFGCADVVIGCIVFVCNFYAMLQYF